MHNTLFGMNWEAALKCMLEMEGIKTPYLKIDSKNKLIHGFSFDREVVEEVIRLITTSYEVSDCPLLTHMVRYDFGDDVSFNTAAIALKMQFS